MKIQLDTVEKTIKVEGAVQLAELVAQLGKLLPNNEWKKYTLESNTIIYNWSSPIILRDNAPRYPYWWTNPVMALSSTDSNTALCNGSETVSGLATAQQATSSQITIPDGQYNIEI